MQFTPKKESEVSSGFKPLPEGDYPFTVLESSEVASKSAKNPGKIMAKLKLAVHGPDGRDQWVFDYFADWFSEWKLRHFCHGVGLGPQYESGAVGFADNGVAQCQGMVRIIIEQDTVSGKERNAVDDYIVEDPKVAPAPAPKPAPKPVQKPAGKADFAALKAAVNAPKPMNLNGADEDDSSMPF